MSTIIEPLNDLTHQDTNWCWGEKQKVAFQITRYLLQNDTILVNFDSSIPIGISGYTYRLAPERFNYFYCHILIDLIFMNKNMYILYCAT